MDPDQTRLLRDTWAEVDRHGDEPILFFYSDLFGRWPHLRRLFGVHMREQRGKLRATLALVVRSAADLDAVTPALEQLGQVHADLGITDEDYEHVAVSLLAMLKEYLGDRWTPEIEAAWTEAYTVVVKVMTAAAQRAPVDPVEGAGHE